MNRVCYLDGLHAYSGDNGGEFETPFPDEVIFLEIVQLLDVSREEFMLQMVQFFFRRVQVI